MQKHPGDYLFSSYSDYIARDDSVDYELALNMITDDEFVRYTSEPNDDKCLEIAQQPRLAVTDAQAKAIIKKISKCRTVIEFQSLNESEKLKFLCKIHEKGVSFRQLSRLTGISKGVNERYMKWTFDQDREPTPVLCAPF